MEDGDPFAGLEDWAKQTERKVKREVRAPAPERPPMSPRAKRYLRLVLTSVAVAVVLAVALPVLKSWLPDNDPTAYATQPVPTGITVTTTESAKPASPFSGTPAEAYAVGEKGISLPKATAVAGFTAAEVGDSLKKVRAAMIGARLDQTMLITHDTKPFLAKLSAGQRDEIAGWFRDKSFGPLATWIYPAAHLNPQERPRVSGRVTYASKKVDGIARLDITTNFVWVYAFTGTDHPLVTVHDEVRWEFADPDAIVPEDRGLRVAEVNAYMFGVDCSIAGQGMLAPSPQSADLNPGPGPSEAEGNYMRPDHSLDIDDNCA